MAHALSFDFVVIGAGILGLTTANELKGRFPGARIAVLEKEPRPGMHASGRNSGVLHSGVYYGRDTLKAKMCARGAARMREFAAEHGIACKRAGKVIIATCAQDIPVLKQLLRNAKDNSIRVDHLDEEEIKKIEPYANVYREGIYSPDTAVIDSLAVLQKLYDVLLRNGVEVFFNQHICKFSPANKHVSTRETQYNFGYLFNCAGFNADIIAQRFGLGGEYALLPFKGIYYRLRKSADHFVRSSIYPVPDIGLPFLGVHLTKVITGEVYVGPTAIPAFGRENYGILEGLRLGESVKICGQMAAMYLRNNQNFRHLVSTEIRKYFKRNFLGATRKLVQNVNADDLVPSRKVGIRPQLINLHTHRLEMDYIIEQTQTSTHVLNAISPAFTSSFAFAEFLVDRSIYKESIDAKESRGMAL